MFLLALRAVLHLDEASWWMLTSMHEQELERLVAERTRDLIAANAATEQALRESEARFRALIENSHDITAVLDAEGVMRYMSPSVQRFFGYSAEEMVGVTSLEFVHPDDQQVVADIVRRARIDPGAQHSCEYRARHKDGSWRTVEAFALNLLDDPAVEGIVITGSDITQRRALESRLVQAERLEAIGQLAGGVAHDFNNILLVIRGYSSVLRGSLEDPQQIDDVEEIIKAADRAADLTRQLLAFGRRQVLEPRLLSLVEVVRGVESLLRRSLREDLELVLELDESASPVIADAGQMEQVLLNLTMNARDAISGNGVVRVSIGESELSGIEDGISPPLLGGRYVKLAVEDTGSGIDEAVLPHVFEPFFTTKEDGVGTGLGLSTVYGIVAQSDGGIEVTTSPGGGASFAIYLPVASGAIDSESWGSFAQAALPMGSETILLVEDEEPVRELVRRVLEGAGYEVLAAGLPSEAERLLTEADHVDLMLTDVVMPEMSGYDLAARVRERRPEIRLMFMSGYAHSVSGAEQAAERLLKKPFAPEQLARAVRSTLDDDPRPETP
jgi:two-component system, cell cycle sensor histidine kinase and response regulator CckA